jgi:predicted small metal-binding protein
MFSMIPRKVVIFLEWSVECDCGWTCRGSEDEIVSACTQHAREEHGMELTREQVFAVARPVENPESEN